MQKSVYKLCLKGTLAPAQGTNTTSVEYDCRHGCRQSHDLWLYLV